MTNSKDGPSVDHIKASGLEMAKKFLGSDDGLELKINRRGLMPDGGGEVFFKCPCKAKLRTIQCENPGKVKRIRGIVYAAKVPPALANRTVEAAKGIMLQYLPDVYINTDHNRGKQSGNSSGFGINLIAETTEGIFYSAESMSCVAGEGVSIPEDIGKDAAMKLLEEIYRGGCVDSSFQWLTCLYMTLGPANITKYLTGPLSEYTIYFLRHLHEFGFNQFSLKYDTNEDDDDAIAGSNKVVLSRAGKGYSNTNKRTI